MSTPRPPAPAALLRRAFTAALVLTALGAPAIARADDDTDDDAAAAPADPCASAVRNTYADFTTNDAVRSMKPEKAIEILSILHERGEVVMTPAPVRDPSQQCKVTKPRPSDKVTIEATVAGVTFVYVKAFTKDGAVVPIKAVPLINLNPRNAVGVYRLAKLLKDQFQASVIYHTGIGGMDELSLSQKPELRKEMHLDGRAIDFVGIKTDDDTEYNVLRDWGKQPAAPPYRLAESDGTEAKLFRAVYEFGTRYYNDDEKTRRPSGIGDTSDVLHPDHPNPTHAAKHINHMHLDISVVPKTY